MSLNWMKQSPVLRENEPSIKLPRSLAEKFEDQSETVIYHTRTVEGVQPGQTFDVGVYLSKKFLQDTSAEEIQKYLDRAVAATLTKNGLI